MSGKVWSGIGAILLAIFGVALEKNWGALTSVITAVSDFLSLPVTVPMYFMVLAALVCIGALIFIGFYVYERRKKSPKEVSDMSGLQSQIVEDVSGGNVTRAAAVPMDPAPPKKTFSAGEINILIEFARRGVTSIPELPLKQAIGQSAIQVEYSLDRLVEKDLIRLSDNIILGAAVVLTEEGKRFIVERGKQLESGRWSFI